MARPKVSKRPRPETSSLETALRTTSPKKQHQELPSKYENANQADDKPRIGATLEHPKHGDFGLGTTLVPRQQPSGTAPSVHLFTPCDQAQANDLAITRQRQAERAARLEGYQKIGRRSAAPCRGIISGARRFRELVGFIAVLGGDQSVGIRVGLSDHSGAGENGCLRLSDVAGEACAGVRAVFE